MDRILLIKTCFGINKPIEEFIGEVVALIHRNDDVEEKWVVVPQRMKITKVEIQKQVHFQEQYSARRGNIKI